MKITDLLSGKDYFYIMHLSYGKNHRRKELWDFARQKRTIGFDNSAVSKDRPLDKERAKENLSGMQEEKSCNKSTRLRLEKYVGFIHQIAKRYANRLGNSQWDV